MQRRCPSTYDESAARALPYFALSACVIIAGFGMIGPVKAWSEGRIPLELITLTVWAVCDLCMAHNKPYLAHTWAAIKASTSSGFTALVKW